MQISNMIQRAFCLATVGNLAGCAYKVKVRATHFFSGIVALVLVALTTNSVVACEDCVAHKMPIPAPTENYVMFAQPGIFTIALVCIAGIALVFVATFVIRRMLAQKVGGQ